MAHTTKPASARWRSGPSLTVWVYDSPLGAAAGEIRLHDLVRRGAVILIEAVTVTWVRGSHRPHVGHLRRRSEPAAASLLCALVAALTDDVRGAEDRIETLVHELDGTGIDRSVLVDARAALTPGTSGLLVLAKDVDLDVVRPIVEHGRARHGVVMVHADLRAHAVERLRRTLVPQSG